MNLDFDFQILIIDAVDLLCSSEAKAILFIVSFINSPAP